MLPLASCFSLSATSEKRCEATEDFIDLKVPDNYLSHHWQCSMNTLKTTGISESCGFEKRVYGRSFGVYYILKGRFLVPVQ